MNNTSKRNFKDQLYGQFERIGKALSNGRRLEILEILAQGEWTVEDLANEVAQPIANVSQHLQVLRRASLVATRKQGTHVFYRLAGEKVFRVWQAMRELGQAHLAELKLLTDDYFDDRASFEAVSIGVLYGKIKNDEVIVLDVRSRKEYEYGHIEGALSFPIEELRARLHEIPTGADVVAYCRGPYCVFSDEAVRELRLHGFTITRLAQGYPDWKAAGFPVGYGLV